MTDQVADITETAKLLALIDQLEKANVDLRFELYGFENFILAFKEMVAHPPPHPDPAAFRAHVASRINEVRETIEKIRALLPEELRITQQGR